MMDAYMFDILSTLEKMIDKQPMYLTDAAKAEKLNSITLEFKVEKDSNGVVTKVQPVVKVKWVK